MTLEQFLVAIQNQSWAQNGSVICFQGNATYPLLFFSLMNTQLKKLGTAVETIDVADLDESIIESKLQTSFLGTPVFYWLKNLADLDEKKRAWARSFLSHYTGPHIVAFFVSADLVVKLPNNQTIVTMVDAIDQKTFLSLIAFFSKNSAIASQHVAHLYKGKTIISLDTACVLMHYIQLLGAHSEQFVTRWLDKIIMPERSLFTLSTLFFAKKGKPFFELWTQLEAEYSELFWIAYWSEQIWRARHYIVLTHNKQFAQAKSIGVRLPFAFLQRDWKATSAAELCAAHNYIYGLDFALKNGGNIRSSLDLFYSKFMQGSFKES